VIGLSVAGNVMNSSTSRIREEFDRIALLSEAHPGAGNFYHRYLLGLLPPHCENALEIGCGTGEFTRLLAPRARSVIAVDLSPQMIRLAQQQSATCSNIEYLTGDVMQLTLPGESFDCVVSIATLHHLPLNQALPKMKDALKPGGVLIIHDLIADEGIAGLLKSALAYPVSVARRLWTTGRLRAPREVRRAWAEHAEGDVYLTLGEVKEMCAQFLPQARVERHLLWRYTVVWQKDGAA
jgi:ubiquinone/menaquinone biosynthesis C-methylase UbiE